MAGNQPDGLADDFFEQILAAAPPYGASGFAGNDGNLAGGSVGLQLGSGSISGGCSTHSASRYREMVPMALPLGLNLEQQGFMKSEDGCGKRFGEDVDVASPNSAGITENVPVHLASLFPGFEQVQTPVIRPPVPPPPLPQLQVFHDQPPIGAVSAMQNPPQVRPRVRARRGQATDPHSIAERLRRERIAERMKALQELVPSANKTDRAAMLDEIVDYVKFLRLQVKVLSMSRLGGTGAVAQLVADVPVSTLEGGVYEEAWEKWSDEGTEQQVAKLMEEDVGAAMQFLQSKALCIMPMSLANAIFHTHHPDDMPTQKLDSDSPL